MIKGPRHKGQAVRAGQGLEKGTAWQQSEGRVMGDMLL